MKHNVIIITCEGHHEKRVIEDLIDKDRFSLDFLNEGNNYDLSTKVVHPGRTDVWFNLNKDKFDIIICIIDNDVPREVDRARSVEILARKLGIRFIPLIQDPFLETFLASCFEEFTINDKLSIPDLKAVSLKFLAKKFGITNEESIKKITINKVINKGGNIKNALRYEKRFGILSLLK